MVTKNDKALFDQALQQGLLLFNEKKFFEAYQVWYERWQLEIGDGDDLLQALLQIAVAFAKIQAGKSSAGPLKLIDSGLKILQGYGSEAFGLDIETFVENVKAIRQQLPNVH